MFLDRYSKNRFHDEAERMKKDVQSRLQLMEKYTEEEFLLDVSLLISIYEGDLPIILGKVVEIESKMLLLFGGFSDSHGFFRTDIYSLLQACKMGFVKERGLLTSVEIIEMEGITKQQFYIQTYDAIKEMPEEQKKNKLPVFKAGKAICATRRDYEAWKATRPRRRRKEN
jgi:hypothetical protein